MAEHIAAALKGNKVVTKDAADFAGTDLLPAQVLLFGCEEPAPPSFSYLEEMLQHINLANRSCALFSPKSKKAVQYLAKMVKSSEAALYPDHLLTEDAGNIEKWTAGVMVKK